MSVNTKMAAIADEIRELSGTTDAMGLDAMANHVGSVNDEVVNQEALLVQIAAALEGKAIGGSGGEQATPTITVNSSGLITATAGTKSATKQLTTQAAKTVAPSVTSQTAVASGVYTTGAIIVEPIPSNYIIPSGAITVTENGTYNVAEKASVVVSIPEKEIVLQNKTINTNGTYSADEGYDGFGQVTVAVTGSANTGAEEVAALLGNTLTALDNNLATSLRSRACQGATKLVTVNLPSVTSMGTYAFYGCSGLTTVHMSLVASIPSQCFYTCTSLKHADFGKVSSIAAQSFNACSALTELILRKTDVLCTLSNVNAINNSPIGKGTGYIYVPAALIEDYKVATNWSTFANQFRAIEDYPEICG